MAVKARTHVDGVEFAAFGKAAQQICFSEGKDRIQLANEVAAITGKPSYEESRGLYTSVRQLLGGEFRTTPVSDDTVRAIASVLAGGTPQDMMNKAATIPAITEDSVERAITGLLAKRKASRVELEQKAWEPMQKQFDAGRKADKFTEFELDYHRAKALGFGSIGELLIEADKQVGKKTLAAIPLVDTKADLAELKELMRSKKLVREGVCEYLGMSTQKLSDAMSEGKISERCKYMVHALVSGDPKLPEAVTEQKISTPEKSTRARATGTVEKPRHAPTQASPAPVPDKSWVKKAAAKKTTTRPEAENFTVAAGKPIEGFDHERLWKAISKHMTSNGMGSADLAKKISVPAGIVLKAKANEAFLDETYMERILPVFGKTSFTDLVNQANHMPIMSQKAIKAAVDYHMEAGQHDPEQVAARARVSEDVFDADHDYTLKEAYAVATAGLGFTSLAEMVNRAKHARAGNGHGSGNGNGNHITAANMDLTADSWLEKAKSPRTRTSFDR